MYIYNVGAYSSAYYFFFVFFFFSVCCCARTFCSRSVYIGGRSFCYVWGFEVLENEFFGSWEIYCEYEVLFGALRPSVNLIKKNSNEITSECSLIKRRVQLNIVDAVIGARKNRLNYANPFSVSLFIYLRKLLLLLRPHVTPLFDES